MIVGTDKMTDYVTLTEAIQRTGISYPRLWRGCVSGELPAQKWAGRWIIHTNDLDAFARITEQPITWVDIE